MERVFRIEVNMEELVSVIVPVYNVEKYLGQCIDSIISQSYSKIEVILINDGSSDDSGKICDDYAKKDDRIKVIHKENGGVSSARNLGIIESTGNWVVFIDSDDWINNSYIEILIAVAKRENADVVSCGYNRVSETNTEKINISGEDVILDSKEYLIKSLNPQTGIGFCHTKLIRKNVVGDIRFDEDIKVAEDALFNMQISKNISKAVQCKKALYNYRNNSNSVVKKYNDNYANNYLCGMKATKKYIFENYDNNEILQNYYNFVAYHVMLVAVNYCYHHDNPINDRKKLLKEICNYDEFKDGIKKSNYKNISLSRKITLFTLKHKLYGITEKICTFRQRQNRKEIL